MSGPTRTGFARAYEFVRAREGGTANDPADRGGLTKWGVTQATYDQWREARHLPRRRVTLITEQECKAIYWGYWIDAGCDTVSAAGKDDVALAVFDCAINCGSGVARKLLQRALGVPEDGVLGPLTRSKLALAKERELEAVYLDVRADHYHAIVERRPSQQGFLNGWMARLRWLARTVGAPITTRFAKTKANGAPTDDVTVVVVTCVAALTAALVALALALPLRAQGGQQAPGVLPHPTRTPGAVLTTDADDVCTPGWAGRHRDVATATKQRVYASYGIQARAPGEYEIDHLISLQLGGSNDVTNLWPERYRMARGAYAKDSVENWLHREVCDGRMTLRAAQLVIARDWTEAYSLMHLDLARRALRDDRPGLR